MLSKDYLQICCDIHIHHNLETVKAWALCPMALRSSFWVCFFPTLNLKANFAVALVLLGLETPIHKYQVATYESQGSPESLFIPYSDTPDTKMIWIHSLSTLHISSGCTVPPLAFAAVSEASGNKEFQQRLKTCDRLTHVLKCTNHPVTQMTKLHEPVYWVPFYSFRDYQRNRSAFLPFKPRVEE